MYHLNQTEIRVLNDYHSLKSKNLKEGLLIQEQQRIIELLYKEYCASVYSCQEDTIEKIINNCLSSDQKFIKWKRANGRPTYKDWHKNFLDAFFHINNIRNKIQHNGYIPIEKEIDLSMVYFPNCLKYYFTHCIEKSRGNISTSDDIASNVLLEFFPPMQQKESITERDKFYVILLIDSSGSMQWPYDKLNNGDKAKGLAAVQAAMRSAQEKALNSLRGSMICLKRSMLVCQYIFNDQRVVLNGPEELSPFGTDRVRLIDNTYIPSGLTAMYDTIEESLHITYDKYLKPAKENKKRIDKVSIAVITDGEDNYIDMIQKTESPETYEIKKAEKIKNIKGLLKLLRGNGDFRQLHLESSILIGLTNNDFTETKLTQIQKEIGFEVAISIDAENEKSLRQAFKTASTNALNI